jgi:Ca-activated chloride channel family protein
MVMSSLNLELIPLRPAVRSDGEVLLDLLVRITPQRGQETPGRPALNLGLVLDHSGSMAGAKKMDYARQAAVYAVQQLLAEDRVSITIFDDTVKVIAPAAPAVDKQRLISLINRVEPAGSTALHAGWQAGANQVREQRLAGGLNRVLLLTDGLANVGETNADNIATDVKRLAVEGIGTTTMGVGADYNEDLLEAMARSGDGNYYYIESPRQLADFFQTELHGLMATVGRGVLLGVEPQSGVEVLAVLNDLDRDPSGRLMLPNLIVGLPVQVVLRLHVPPQQGSADLCGFRLTWLDDQRGEQFRTATLRLPALNEAGWEQLPAVGQVREQAALQTAGRSKRASALALESGDAEAAQRWLTQARTDLAGLEKSAEVLQEEEDIAAVESKLQARDYTGHAKMAKYQHYNRSRNRPRQS